MIAKILITLGLVFFLLFIYSAMNISSQCSREEERRQIQEAIKNIKG